MVNKDNSERIERYLRDQMSTEENEAFLNELRNDKALREEAQMMALMIKGMKEEQARQDAETINQVLASKKPAALPAIIKKLRWPLSIAAMLVIIFGVTLWWNNKYFYNDALFHEYYSTYNVQGTPRGGDSDVEKELVALFNQIGTTDDVSTVIVQLQKVYDAIDSEKLFNMSVAAEAVNDTIDSEYEYGLLADDITWYLALAYLKDDKPAKAKELLKPLAKKGDKKALKLIEEIK